MTQSSDIIIRVLCERTTDDQLTKSKKQGEGEIISFSSKPSTASANRARELSIKTKQKKGRTAEEQQLRVHRNSHHQQAVSSSSEQCCGAGAALLAGAVKKGAATAQTLQLKLQL